MNNITIKRGEVELDYKRFLFPGGEVGIKLANNYKYFYDSAPHQTISVRIQNSEDVMALVMSYDAGFKLIRSVSVAHGPYKLLQVTKGGHVILEGREDKSNRFGPSLIYLYKEAKNTTNLENQSNSQGKSVEENLQSPRQ